MRKCGKSDQVKLELTGGKYYREVELPLKIQQLNAQRVLWHRHKDFYELVIVCSGSARHLNQVRSETIYAGHAFLMPERSAHRYLEQKNFRYYNLIFHPSLLKFEIPGVHLENLPGYAALFDFQFSGENRCSRLLMLDEITLAKLVTQLSELRDELRERRPGWQESAYFLFMRIVVSLLREGTPAGSDPAPHQNAFPIGHAIHLMEQNCAKNFTIKKLAEAAGTSPSCFRHNFTRIVGQPPREYLLELRIRRAIQLLNGPESIGETALRAGFSDSNYFSRIIRARLGLPPREIRRRYNTGELTPEKMLEQYERENGRKTARSRARRSG